MRPDPAAPQLVPSATADQALVEVPGVQTWQAFAGFSVPAVYTVPAMSQSAEQAPAPLQMRLAPQPVPAATLDQALVEVPGTQTWQAFCGFTVPAAYSAPPM
jgi:hypothetical protein